MIGRPRTTDHKAIKTEIEKGRTAQEISNHFEISTAQVYKVAKVYSIKVATPKVREHPQMKQIAQRVLETGNGFLVDEEFGLSPGSSKRLCRKYGIHYELRIGKQKLQRTSEQLFQERPDWKQMFDMHEEGYTNLQIAEYFRVSPPTVNRVIRDLLGVHVGKGNHNPKKVHLPDSVGSMYVGLRETCQEIASKFQTSRKAVQKKLDQLNIPRRVGKATGPKNPQWKGGKERTVYKFRRQSYEVVAICLGKPLQAGHVIHHINENPKNNNPENLMIFPSQSLHAKFHQSVLKNQWKVDSAEAIQKALEIGGVLLPKPNYPIEF